MEVVVEPSAAAGRLYLEVITIYKQNVVACGRLCIILCNLI